MTKSFYTLTSDGLILAVRVTPNARRTGVEGIWNETHLKIALNAPAVDGQANEALIYFLKEKFGLRKSDIEITSGQTARYKIIKIKSTDPKSLIFEI